MRDRSIGTQNLVTDRPDDGELVDIKPGCVASRLRRRPARTAVRHAIDEPQPRPCRSAEGKHGRIRDDDGGSIVGVGAGRPIEGSVAAVAGRRQPWDRNLHPRQADDAAQLGDAVRPLGIGVELVARDHSQTLLTDDVRRGGHG